jgi:hypothetical protein
MMRTSNRQPTMGATALWAAAALAAAALTLGSASPAAAQDIKRPNLAGHTFLSTDLVPDAFVRTYVRNTLGYAQALNVDYPSVVIRGDTLLTLEGDLVYAILSFEYQQRVKDWIAARLAVGGRTRLGTQASSLVISGVTVNTGLDFGWLARIHQSRTTSLCAAVNVSNQTYTTIDVKQFAEDVIDGVPDAKLIDDVPTVRSSGGVRFAWAISRPFGLTALLEGSYGESPRRHEADSWEYNLGASVDFDAGAAFGVPLGAALAYWQTSLPVMAAVDAKNTYQTALRLAYNGQPDFLIALDLTGMINHDNARRESVKAGGAQISLRYYF